MKLKEWQKINPKLQNILFNYLKQNLHKTMKEGITKC